MDKGKCVVCGSTEKVPYGKYMCPTCYSKFNFEEHSKEVDNATYNPEDDKIRIYSGHVSTELYAALSQLGYQRAYKQGCFYAVWTPQREDAALGLCGEIEDDEYSMLDRALDRSDRYEGYSGNAAKRSKEHSDYADNIAERFAGGQPILIGHHSEKRARRDQERIHTNMRASIEEHKKSKYWAWRAQATVTNAEWKRNPYVTASRIKKLKAEAKKQEKKAGQYDISWLYSDWGDREFPDVQYFERPKPSALTPEQLESWHAYRDMRIERNRAWHTRWQEHYEGLLEYWEEVYRNEAPEEVKEKLERRFEKGQWVMISSWHGPVWGHIARVNKSRVTGDINTVSIDKCAGTGRYYTNKWAPSEIKAVLDHEPTTEDLSLSVQEFLERESQCTTTKHEPDEALQELEEKLEQVENTEIKVNHDPDYYSTPHDIVDWMLEEAAISSDDLVLEPSAGDGRIADKARDEFGAEVHCCEINPTARQHLLDKDHHLEGSDFMQYNPGPIYDVIVANPPFSKEQAMHHFLHAWNDCLKPGGRMVFILPGGTFKSQLKLRKQVEDIVGDNGTYDDLPDEAFKEVGTNVKTFLVVVNKA